MIDNPMIIFMLGVWCVNSVGISVLIGLSIVYIAQR